MAAFYAQLWEDVGRLIDRYAVVKFCLPSLLSEAGVQHGAFGVSQKYVICFGMNSLSSYWASKAVTVISPFDHMVKSFETVTPAKVWKCFDTFQNFKFLIFLKRINISWSVTAVFIQQVSSRGIILFYFHWYTLMKIWLMLVCQHCLVLVYLFVWLVFNWSQIQ